MPPRRQVFEHDNNMMEERLDQLSQQIAQQGQMLQQLAAMTIGGQNPPQAAHRAASPLAAPVSSDDEDTIDNLFAPMAPHPDRHPNDGFQ